MEMKKSVEMIEDVCKALAANQTNEAEQIIRARDRFIVIEKTKRKYSFNDKMETFLRDGFVDGYSGERLIFPGTLLLISKKISDDFPYHRNWAMDKCHIAYWKLYPTIDHIDPIARCARGGDDKKNWITTSQLRNSAKANWTIKELGWTICAPETINKWDGMTRWFLDFTDKDKSLLAQSNIRKWYNAAAKFRDHPLLAKS